MSTPSDPESPAPVPTTVHIPFRDPTWLATENAYLTLSITSLNALTRTYNLMAPDLAKKPYFSLARELASCYSDVAPQLPGAIAERAAAPKRRPDEGFGWKGMGEGVGEVFGGKRVVVRDERPGRRYGFREFWRDVWGEKK
jgi:hypothetical protein